MQLVVYNPNHASVIQVRKNYKYRLYRCDKNDVKLREKLFVASLVWNYFIGLHQMNKDVLKLRRTARFARWTHLHSQSCQDVYSRINEGLSALL